MAIVDMNGDGLLDLVSANSTDSTISVLLASAPGVFLPNVEYQLSPATGSAGYGFTMLLAKDLNMDGLPDAAVAATRTRARFPFSSARGRRARLADFDLARREPNRRR